MRGKRRPRWRLGITLAILTGVATPVFAIAANIVTSTSLPTVLQPFQPWAWPAFGLLAVLLLAVAIAEARSRGKEKLADPSEADARGPGRSAALTSGAGSQITSNQISGNTITQTGSSISIGGSVVSIGSSSPAQPNAEVSAQRIVPAMLPPDITDFVGRTTELKTLQEALIPVIPGEGRTAIVVASVAGQPGGGKSALAIHCAHQLFDQFPDGQFYVDLRGGDREPLDAATVLDVFLYTAGIPAEKVPGDLAGRQALYRTWLAGKRVLIVLDNAVDERQVSALLPGRPPAAVLVTSREPLPTVSTERPLRLQTLDADSAESLLWAVARRPPTQAEGPVARVVAQRCGYLPLALRIAGATLLVRPYWSMRNLAESLADERMRLEQLSNRGLGRTHLDVRASVDLSYSSLDKDVARSFRLLGGIEAVEFSRDLAEAVIGAPATTSQQHIDRLVDAQLLEPYVERDRYHFHDLIRLFASERLELSDETTSAQQRVFDWYIQLLQTMYKLLHPINPIKNPEGAEGIQAEVLAKVDAERMNLLPVINSAVRAGKWSEVSRLAFPLGGYFRMRSAWDDWRRVGQLGLDAANQSKDKYAETSALQSLGTLHELTNELDLATEYCTASLALSRPLNDKWGQFESLRVLGIIQTKLGDLDTAIGYFGEGLVLARELEYGWGIGAALHHLGRCYRRKGLLDEAINYSQQSLQESQRLGNRWGEATNLNTLGDEFREKGDLDQAVSYYQDAKALYEELGDRWGVANASHNIGVALRDHGQPDVAKDYLQASKLIYQELGDADELQRVLRSLGENPANLA